MADNPTSRKLNNDPIGLRLQENLTLPFGSSTRQVAPQGSVIYDNLSSDTPQVYFSDGTEWKILGGGGVEVVPDVTLEPVGPEGTIVYNEADDKLYYSDGVSWIEVGSGAVEVVPDVTLEPVGPKGTIVYNEADDNLYYSNGVAWVVVGSGGGGETLAQTLVNGNLTGANDLVADLGNIIINDGQRIQGGGNTGDILPNNATDSLTVQNKSGTSYLRVTSDGSEQASVVSSNKSFISSSGAGADAIQISATAGGIDIDAAVMDVETEGLISLTSTTTGGISLTSTSNNNNIILTANAPGTTVEINDHLTFSGGTPSVFSGTATIDAGSTDTSGRISGWDTSSNLIIAYSRGFAAGTRPVIVLTPTDNASSLETVYVDHFNSNTASFELVCSSTPSPLLSFYYHVFATT